VEGIELELELDRLKKIDREKQCGAWPRSGVVERGGTV